MDSLFHSIGTGIVIGIIILVLIVIAGVLKVLLFPSKDPKETPMLFTYSETNSLGIPENIYCSVSAHENVLEIKTATQSQKQYQIEYNQISKFETIPKYYFTFSSYSAIKKATNIPLRFVLEYTDDAGTEQKAQFKFDQGKKEKALNIRTLWTNNIFDYINARMSKNK